MSHAASKVKIKENLDTEVWVRTLYNYLSEGGKFIAEMYNCEDYSDPDGISQKLYRDIEAVCRQLCLDNGAHILGKIMPGKSEGDYPESQVELSCGSASMILTLGVDYIGPSRCSAQKALLRQESCGERDSRANQFVGEFLVWARTIGGHILWPRRILGEKRIGNTINQARGQSFADRFDALLFQLLKYMKDGDCQDCMKLPFENSKEWLELFKPSEDCTYLEWFDSFVKFWKLEGFVDFEDERRVLNLAYDPDAKSGNQANKYLFTVAGVKDINKQKYFEIYRDRMQPIIEERSRIFEEILADQCVK